MRESGVPESVAIATVFFIVATAILLLHEDVVPYRPDQPITHDIVARVAFDFNDKNRLEEKRHEAAQSEPRIYRAADPDAWATLEQDLKSLPQRLAASPGDVPPDLKPFFENDPGTMTALRHSTSPEEREGYQKAVALFVDLLRNHKNKATDTALIILKPEERQEDLSAARAIKIGSDRAVAIPPSQTYALDDRAQLQAVFETPAEKALPTKLRGKLVDYALARLGPTHVLNEDATIAARNAASTDVPLSEAKVHFARNSILVYKAQGKFDPRDWLLLRAENSAYIDSLKGSGWKPKVGIGLLSLIVTLVLSAYVARFQPRIVKNHARAAAIAALLLSMLLLAQLAGIGNGPIYLFGVAPTILVAMILTIAYDQRFSIGMASMHGLLVTVALGQGTAFFMILWVGVLISSFMLDDIRTRSKLIEVGGATAIAMIAAAVAAGLLAYDTPNFILRNSLYCGAAGLAVGFIVLGILPFIERSFRITTSMTLLELADANQELLRRLHQEAPGTYNHSLQVATLSEAAAETIGANSLLCRVASYYHDIGKINKADYFVENQSGGENRHVHLDPNLSQKIIVGHVKDGVALAREYNLPTSIVPFIEQHHGTTLVEYFYRQACNRQVQEQPDSPAIADHEFRYPGPKPRSRETAIVMLADAVESATRAMDDPEYPRVEKLVHDLALKRLLDGQFDECDLTTRDLDLIERSMVRSLMGIHHGRIAYPPSATIPAAHPSSASIRLA